LLSLCCVAPKGPLFRGGSPRKSLVRYARRNENFVLVSGEAASTADAILSRNSYLTARFLRGIKRGAG